MSSIADGQLKFTGNDLGGERKGVGCPLQIGGNGRQCTEANEALIGLPRGVCREMDDEIECFAVGDDQIVGNVIEFGKSVALGFLEGHRPALQGIDTSLWREYKGRNGSAAEKDRGEKGFLDPVAG